MSGTTRKIGMKPESKKTRNSEFIGFRLSGAARVKVERIAKKTGQPMSEVIRTIIEGHGK